ncbi:hypothetical protein DFA_07859 [Cavenderia fasciculata]|uniref:Uncharacterized protein n=1 Tax=Cavenderia fasciculata TaxID=261658 RepID=F4Q3R3_CACFS|nr:uncharacterized protein DFA_07859 [Cavenderia fasciculata]EGG16879.1 hypothetical protein DFA_07859 [Cavenderia fasciculata]|eukprot:XP_004355353.1 hypothetical protein DFA_07859 [Cavenderia fasciculata]
MTDQIIIEQIKTFCFKVGINTSKILAITIQENKSNDFLSLVIDFQQNKILPQIPIDLLLQDNNKEKSFGNYRCFYNDDLELSNGFLCCSNLMAVEPKISSSDAHKDRCFVDFINCRGNHPDLIFEVKKVQDTGAQSVITTTNHQILNNKLVKVDSRSSTLKMITFRNFKCSSHKIYYGIDVYQSQRSGATSPQIRLSPFTTRNDSLMSSFFQENYLL